MERKKLIKKLLDQLEEGKRKEAYERLRDAEDLEGMTAVLQEYGLGATSPEEMLALAQEQGYELTDEELEQVAGGRPDWLPTPNTNCYTCSCN